MKCTNNILLAFYLLLIVGCAPLRTDTQPGTHYLTWQARQKQLSTIKSWNIKSAISIKYNNQNDIAHFNWKQNKNKYAIDIYSPLNLVSVKIIGDNKKVSLIRSPTNKISAKSPEILMQKELGWALPISNLKYWIIGLPAPEIKYNAKFDSYNHLSYLKQQNWSISYNDFLSINNIDLPGKIVLQNRNIAIRIVIKKYEIFI